MAKERTLFDEGKGNYFICSPTTKRGYGTHDQAVAHATEYIAQGNEAEFLIVQVVGLVKRCAPPVEYVPVED